jgi:NAD(P)H-flavin reductase
VQLRALIWQAPGVLALELSAPDDRLLPTFEPGAHVDLTLPDGTRRQYSLCGMMICVSQAGAGSLKLWPDGASDGTMRWPMKKKSC